MRKVRTLTLGATVAGMLAVTPGSASAWPLKDAFACTNYAQRQWDPTSPASTQQYVTRVEDCWMAYLQFFASQQNQQDFVLCMDRAIDAYRPPTYVDYTLAITIYCVENYTGYDINIGPKVTTSEPPPVTQKIERQRRAKRRATRSHRTTRS